MNSRWWRIFAKVEFVRVVSNIIVQDRVGVVSKGLGFGLCVDRVGVVS